LNKGKNQQKSLEKLNRDRQKIIREKNEKPSWWEMKKSSTMGGAMLQCFAASPV
jgi:hypothetical protein